MIQVEVTCPGIPFVNSNRRENKFVKARHAAAWRAAGMAEWLSAGHQWVQWDAATAVAELWYPTSARHDPGNDYVTVKAVIDGIQDAGRRHPFLPDDDWRHLTGPDLRYGGVRLHTPTVLLTFHEADPITTPHLKWSKP